MGRLLYGDLDPDDVMLGDQAWQVMPDLALVQQQEPIPLSCAFRRPSDGPSEFYDELSKLWTQLPTTARNLPPTDL